MQLVNHGKYTYIAMCNAYFTYLMQYFAVNLIAALLSHQEQNLHIIWISQLTGCLV